MCPYYNRAVVFTLTEARELLPSVQEMTAEAVRQAEALADAMDDLDETTRSAPCSAPS